MIVNTGCTYRFFDDSLKTYKELPAKTYRIVFEPMSGFSLETRDNIIVSEKAYGKHLEKIEKVFSTHETMDRNLGIILSGDKGIGKTLFAKMIAEKAICCKIPVIVVDKYYDGIATFIGSICQKAVIIFDEFDKTFVGKTNDQGGKDDPQTEMLTLFDGTTNGKKMFVITCNEIHKLNNYLINRPGRFHYHFRFDYPNDTEIKEYMSDFGVPENKVHDIVCFAAKTPLNYDCLRAIAFEVNRGYSFKEAISDLNIVNYTESNPMYKIVVKYENGNTISFRHRLDLFDEECVFYVTSDNYSDIASVSFNPVNISYDNAKLGYILLPDDFTYKEEKWFKYLDKDDADNSDYIDVYDKYHGVNVIEIFIRRISDTDIHYKV